MTTAPSGVVESKAKRRMVPLADVLQVLESAGIPLEVRSQVVTATEYDPITLEEAASITGRSYRTLQRWVDWELLPEIGRKRSPGKNGGKVLVDRRRVEELRDNPPKPGPKA